MTQPEFYRAQAAKCDDDAARQTDLARAHRLKLHAREWRELADKIERMSHRARPAQLGDRA
jgi:hypothetical protein